MRKKALIVTGIALVVAASVLAGLAGCGSQETSAGRIRLGYLNNDLHQLAFYVAQQKGFFEEEGLVVEVAGVYSSGPEEMSAFQSGALDAGYLGMAPAMLAVANGKAEVKALAQANLNGSSIVVRDPGEASSVGELGGRKVAVPNVGTVQDFLLRKALGNEGLSINDVNEILMPPPEMLAALSSSSVDACVFWEPNPTTAEQRDLGTVLLSSEQIWEDHPCCAVVVSEDLIENEPATAEALARAHRKATGFINDHPDEAVRLAAEFTGLDEEVARRAMQRITFTTEFNPEAIREYAAFLAEQGLAGISDPAAFTDEFLYR